MFNFIELIMVFPERVLVDCFFRLRNRLRNEIRLLIEIIEGEEKIEN